jgi:hypothetical protein
MVTRLPVFPDQLGHVQRRLVSRRFLSGEALAARGVHIPKCGSSKRKEDQMAKNTSVMGIYPDRTTVSDAINVLHQAGYRATDISVLSADNQGSKDFAHEKHTKALEGAATGTAAGAAVGAALAWLVSIQTLTIAGLGPLVPAGPVLAAFAGAGAGGTLGWIAGLLTGLRLTEYIAKRYAGRIRRGGLLLSVHCDSQEWCDRARKTLKDTGARDISSASEAAADFGTTDKPTVRAPAALADRTDVVAAKQEADYATAHEPKK